MISTVIKDRMEVVGLTQANLAEAIGCTPTQLSLFLKDEASLNRKSLDKCFTTLGISFDSISKRIELAKEISQSFKGKDIEEIITMSRTQMIEATGINDLKALPEVTKEEFEIMVSSGIGEYEATFPYFKTLVLHFLKVDTKITPKSAEKSFSALATALLAVPFIPYIGVGSAIGAAIGAMVLKKTFFSKAVKNAWAPLLTLSMSLFDFNNKPNNK